MFTLLEFFQPETLEDAYNKLVARKTNTILGGCAFLKMGSKRICTGIDLSKLNLNYINETDNYIEIGASTTFRDIETNETLNSYFNGVLKKAVKDIIGVQFRNMVTVGASVYSKYGFSDFITALRVIDTTVVLHNSGEISLDEFIDSKREKDILEKIIIKKENLNASFKMMRNSIADYAILNVAASKSEQGIKIVVGARPSIAVFPEKAMEYINSNEVNEKTAEKAGEIASEELAFGSNGIGSAEYRKHLCKALVESAILEVL